MAIILSSKYPGGADAPSTDYPQGRIRNESTPGAGDLTPLDDQWANDFQAVFGALLNAAGITPNNVVDTAQASQIYEALLLGINAEMDSREVGYIIVPPIVKYDNKLISVNSENTVPGGVAFKSDGTKMYVVGSAPDSVHQYSLATAWDLSTASFDSVSFSVTTEATNPTDISFKSDGTKMYIVGSTTQVVYQYSLPTPWVLTGASYDSVSFSVSAQIANPQGMTFKTDGSKMYLVDQTGSIVYQYSLPTPWVLTGASYDSVSFSVNSEDTAVLALEFNSDGTKMFIPGSTNDAVFQYSLPTPWVLTGASYDSVSFSIASEDNVPLGIAFKATGGKMYILGSQNDSVYQYNTGFVGG